MKEIDVEDKVYTFIKEFNDDLYSLELLLFFSRHPNARFNRTVVLHAPIVSGRQFDTSIALRRLMDKKLVVTYAENGIMLYALTKEEPAHTLAADLVNIDQRQWQIILEQILDSQGIQ